MPDADLTDPSDPDFPATPAPGGLHPYAAPGPDSALDALERVSPGSAMNSQPRLHVIVAMARNRVIGVRNTLPWHLPEDLRHFKALTLGHPMVMGRKTYESIGRPLPGRTTVIVTRDPAYRVDGCLTATSIDQAIALAAQAAGGEEVFFVGGAELYAQALPRADLLHLTEIQADYEGDAWFPAFDPADWREQERERAVSDAGLGYHFVTYARVA